MKDNRAKKFNVAFHGGITIKFNWTVEILITE